MNVLSSRRIGRVLRKEGDWFVVTTQIVLEDQVIVEDIKIHELHIKPAKLGDLVELNLQTGFAESDNYWAVNQVLTVTGRIKDALESALTFHNIPPPFAGCAKDITDRITGRDMPGVPDHLKSGLRLYLEKGMVPGAFLTHVLENDLAGCIVRVDATTTITQLRSLLKYLVNSVPALAWGTRDKVKNWSAATQEERDAVLAPMGGIR